MAKSPLERQLEAQMKQEKQLANKQKREGERRAREQKKMEREAMIRERAASIVNGQPLVWRKLCTLKSSGKLFAFNISLKR